MREKNYIKFTEFHTVKLALCSILVLHLNLASYPGHVGGEDVVWV